MRPTIMDLVDMGMLKKKDHFAYRPNIKEYWTNPENTGCESIKLMTDDSPGADNIRAWSVAKVYSDGSIDIERLGFMTYCTDKVELRGVTGYLRGFIEIENICRELFSRPERGIMARSSTLEDEEGARKNCKPFKLQKRAYYPSSYSKELTARCLVDDVVYDCKKCAEGERFFHPSSAGKEIFDKEKGVKFVEPLEGYVLCVRERGYLPKVGWGHFYSGHWLPSHVNWFEGDSAYWRVRDDSRVCYGLNISDGRIIKKQELFDSRGNEFSAKFGLLPVVHIPGYVEIAEDLMPYTEIESGGGMNPATMGGI